MKRTLRGLGIGLFLAGALYTVLDYLESPANPETVAQYKQTIQELEMQLKTAKEQVSVLEKQVNTTDQVTTDEPVKETISEELTDAEEPDADTVPVKTVELDQKEDATDEKVVTGTIFIYEGVSLYDIGKQAEDVGIVRSSRELELFLAKPEYAKSIQKGQFDLTSDMTLEEMAKILTGKTISN